jgi:hypothetical protein
MNQKSEIMGAHTITPEEYEKQGKTSGGSTGPWGSRITLVYLVPCHESANDVVQHLCGRSQMRMSLINFGDLPCTCFVPGAVFK